MIAPARRFIQQAAVFARDAVRRRRSHAIRLLGIIGCLVAIAACDDPSDPINGDPPEEDVRLESVTNGLVGPVHLTSPPDDPRLFVVEQPGRIRIIEEGELLEDPFLDLTGRVRSGGERGLLSMAFHPEYRSNGIFLVYYTDLSGDTRVERFTAAPDANSADSATGTIILAVTQPFSNHNGGLLAFGPDGMLYVALGDGGSSGDPLGHGQNTGTLLGSILRIDVDAGEPYAIPPDNPLVDDPDARGEIWAYGLRNPWRFSFDPAAGLLYIADVGQNQWEEINVSPDDRGGLNYGWSIMEGAHCYPDDPCDAEGLELPAVEYPHSLGCSVTGGHVYRGEEIPALRGTYFYADYCEGWIRSLRYQDGAVIDGREWDLGDIGRITAFGQDAAGELYVLSASGGVFRFVAD